MKLSDKIAELRKRNGWSQEQLAVKLEVSRQAVYKWEADINQPDLDKLKRIARLFDVSYNVLMDDDLELPSINQIVEVEPKTEENEEEPHVEILENVTKDENSKTVHNEVAVQINCAKENPKPANKKLVISLCVFAAIIVVCLCALSYIIFGIVLQKDSYLVKFDTQCEMVISDLVIKDGKALNNVTTPTKNGYTFDGWYIGDKKWDFDKDKVKGNITLTAKWIANENKITYINYETGEKHETSAKTDETVVLDSNTFKKEGYAFGGWATSPNGDTVYTNCDSFKMGAEPITLYAVWVLDEFTLTLNAGNGVINDTYPQKFTSNDTVTLPIPELEYYTFDGWYDENNVKYDTVPKGTVTNLTLSAKYSPIKYKINYVLNGGTNHASNPTEYAVGNEIVLLDPTKDGVGFGGWYYDDSFFFEFDSEISIEFGEDLTLYAMWNEDCFEFEEFEDGFMLTKYEGNNKRVVIPDTYLYGDVVGISAYAFKDCIHVEEIVIPSTVYNIELPAFEDCSSLTTITVDKYNAEFSSIDGVLFNKSGTWLYKYPAGRQDTVYVAPNSVDVIGDYAFAYSIYLAEVYLPNDPTLTYGIGKVCQGAFEGCLSLTTVELGYIANYFEMGCFSNCWSLESIEFKAETVWGIEERAFEGCLLLENVIFNCGSVKEIGTNVFTGCVSLTTLDLSVVEKIGAEAFSESGITELYIPLSVSYVGNQIFVNCLYDEIIVYCEAQSKPADWAYNWSYGANEVIWGADGEDNKEPESTVEFTYGLVGNTAVITGCVGSGVVTVPVVIDDYLVKGIEPYAFSGNANITEIIIPSSIPSIDVSAFENCPGLEKITYVNSGAYTEIRSVDGVLFGDYGRAIIKYPEGKKDSEYIVPTNVDIIRKFAFKNNTHLTKITLPSDIDGDNYVGKIEQGGFEGCSSLEYVYGCAVGYFDKEAFKNCTSLKELTCVNVISFIMNQAFVNCVSLESVTFKKDVGIINWQSFGYCTNLESVAFSGKVETFGWGCFEGCSSLKGIIIPEGATVIGGEAFKLCSSLESVVISSTVTKIEKNAFLDTGLKEIFIPLTVTTIDEFAFMGANDIKISCQAQVKPADWNEKWNYTVVDGEELLLNTIWGVDNNSQDYDGYVLNGDGTLCLNSFTGTGNVTVPSEHDGKTVTSISENAFSGQTSITGIHIPKTITSIDVKAFNGLINLESITVDAENTEYTALGGVLYNKSMITLVRYPAAKADKEFSIPYEVEKIGSYSFYGCQYIESVLFLAETNTYDPIDGIMNNAFEGCASLKSFTVSKYIDNIGEYAFNNCALFSEFNNEANYLRTVGAKAFANTAIKNMYIPFATHNLGAEIFEGCTDVTVDFELNNPYVDWLNWDERWDTDVSSINYGVATDSISSKKAFKVDEENNVFTLIACTGTDVINDICHYYEMELVIGPYALANLKGVNKLILPYNTVEIHPLAFYNSEILEFSIQGGLDPEQCNYSVLDGVLYSKDGKTLVRYPSAKADEEFIIPSTVTKIAENAFSGATNLKKVQIKSNVTEIGKNAFSYLSGLTLYCQVDAVPSGWDSAFADGIKGIEWISADATSTAYVTVLDVVANRKQKLR